MILFILAIVICLACAVYFEIQWLRYGESEDLFRVSIFNYIVLVALGSLTLLYMSTMIFICVIAQMLFCSYLLYRIIKLRL
jgi:hypothetical protein